MSTFSQIAAVTSMNVRALPGRKGASLVIVVGMIMVVGVTMSVLSMSSGMAYVLRSSAQPDRVTILARDAQYEGQSSVQRADVQTILDNPGIKRNASGEPFASADMIVGVPAKKMAGGFLGFVPIRGVTKNFFLLRPEVHLIEGRMFTPALHEMIVGKHAREQYQGFGLGDEVGLQDGDWKIVGVFDSDAIWASGALADADTLMASYRRPAYNSVTVRIDPGARAFADFKAALTSNPTLTVEPQQETAYFESQIKGDTAFLRFIAYWIGGVMGMGGVFGALNCMYAAVSGRRVEIATLRAIGFGPAPVVISVIVEALLLAVVGAVIGSVAAWVVFNGRTYLYGSLALPLTINTELFMAGVSLALVIGLIGALFPAIRAARLPVVTALQVR